MARGSEITEQHVEQLSGVDRGDYWWYAVRRAHVERELRRRPRERMAYLDLGCGTGGMMSHVRDAFGPERCVGLDGTEAAVRIAAERGLDARYADFREPLELPFRPDTVTCLDVLEHLADARLALRHLADAATDDARLVVTVPAMPSLWSPWDELSGHHRRYVPRTLRDDLEAGGWRCERVRHFFAYCVPPAWVQRRVLRRVQELEFPPVSPLVNRVMTLAGAVERALGSPFPFGTSLIATATRRRA